MASALPQATAHPEQKQTRERISLRIPRSDLLTSLSHVQSVVEKRGTIPILSNIRLDIGDGTVSFTATDMELAVVDRTFADMHGGGSTTVPAHMLYDIVRKLPDGSEITLEESPEGHSISLTAGSAQFSLSTLPVDDFPAITDGELPHHFVLTREECRSLIEKTRFAMSTEETRYYLNGVYLHAVEDEEQPCLRAVATDGHRLSRVQVALPAGAAGMPGAIIPRKAITELCKLLEDKVVEVRVALSDTKIRFTCGDVVLVSKLIDGSFPDYARVIPQHNPYVCECGSVAFAKAVDRVSVVSSEKARGVKLVLAADALTLTTSSSDHNSAQERIEAQFDGQPMDIGFNARYLLDILGHMESPQVRVRLSDTSAPALLEDPADASALYVIMPMRV